MADISKYVDKAHEQKDFTELAELPIDALQEFATLCGAGVETAEMRAATGRAVQITWPATRCSFGVE